MKGRIFEAGHTTAPDHMPDRAQDSTCIQRGVHTRGRFPGSLVRLAKQEQVPGVNRRTFRACSASTLPSTADPLGTLLPPTFINRQSLATSPNSCDHLCMDRITHAQKIRHSHFPLYWTGPVASVIYTNRQRGLITQTFKLPWISTFHRSRRQLAKRAQVAVHNKLQGLVQLSPRAVARGVARIRNTVVTLFELCRNLTGSPNYRISHAF
jgi:hypothetical protein